MNTGIVENNWMTYKLDLKSHLSRFHLSDLMTEPLKKFDTLKCIFLFSFLKTVLFVH